MGSCVSTKSSKFKSYEYDRQPSGSQQLKHLNLSKLLFNLTLANIKLKKCKYQKISVKFHIPEVLQQHFEQQLINENNEAKWKSQKKTKFEMNELQLRKKFLYIYVYNENKQIGKIKINLYIITIGPYHQDFLISFKNNTNARISFDCKISQIVDIKIDSIKTQIDLIKKHPGEKFSFSIKPIMQQTQNQLNISVPSYTVMQVLDDSEQSIDIQNNITQLQSPLSTKLTKRTSLIKIKQPEKKIKKGSNLIWTKNNSLQLPSIRLKILSSDLHHSYFQILIWKINDQINQEQQLQKLQYHAECFISFHKLLSSEPIISIVEGKKYQERQISVEQKLWMYGKQCGSAKFNFKIFNQTFMKQIPVCVRTQKGIQKLAPIFLSTSTQSSQSSSHKQIQKLIKINQQISSKMIQSQKLISQFGMYRQARKLQIQIQQHLLQIKQLLQKSIKNNNNIRIYEYLTPKQLLIAQETFLQIGNQIKDYLQNQDHSINQICWLILIALLKRGQFTLAYIGFDEKQRNAIENNQKSKLLQRKICVAENYQSFICEILKLAINALNTEGMDCQKQFAEISCAYAYFRITQFRNQVLQSIARQNDPEVAEWRGIQFMLDQDQDFTLIREQMNALSLLFDWQHCFHKCLQKKTNIEEILADQQCNTWKQRFAKRSIAFFKFIKRWVDYIESIIPSGKGIQWKYCPGYNRILKAFLIQLKTRQIKLYPDAMKQAALKLLVNEKIISPFITILFNKVNLYDTQSVAQVLQFISEMFLSLQSRKKKIPAIFNFSTFLKGIKLIFESQASYSVSAALILLYNHLAIFPLQFQRNISMFLLSKVFFRLFLHWQQNVRDIFYHLLIYRILHEYKIIEGQQQRILKKQYNFQIRGRYQKLMNILKNAENNRVKQQRKFNKILQDKYLYLRMKKKFQRKRKKRQTMKFGFAENDQNFHEKQLRQLSQCQSQQDKQTKTRQQSDPKYSVIQFQIPSILQKANSARIENQNQIQNASILQNFKSFKTQIFNNNNNNNNENQHPNNCGLGSIHFQNQVKDMTQLDNHNKESKLRIKNSMQQSYANLRFFNKQQSFEIKQLRPEQIHYLKISMKRFNEILDTYNKNIGEIKKFQLPQIKMQKAMIDKKQLQPDKVEDW